MRNLESEKSMLTSNGFNGGWPWSIIEESKFSESIWGFERFFDFVIYDDLALSSFCWSEMFKIGRVYQWGSRCLPFRLAWKRTRRRWQCSKTSFRRSILFFLKCYTCLVWVLVCLLDLVEEEVGSECIQDELVVEGRFLLLLLHDVLENFLAVSNSRYLGHFFFVASRFVLEVFSEDVGTSFSMTSCCCSSGCCYCSEITGGSFTVVPPLPFGMVIVSPPFLISGFSLVEGFLVTTSLASSLWL